MERPARGSACAIVLSLDLEGPRHDSGHLLRRGASGRRPGPLAIVALQPLAALRLIFVCFRSVGFLWHSRGIDGSATIPRSTAAVNDAELRHILAERPGDVPHAAGWHYWVTLLRSRSMLALCVICASNSAMFYFCITWLPTYLHGSTASTRRLWVFSPDCRSW